MQNAEVVWVFPNHFPGALPEPHNLMSFPDGMRQAEVSTGALVTGADL